MPNRQTHQHIQTVPDLHYLTSVEIDAAKYQGGFRAEAIVAFEPQRDKIHIRAKDVPSLELAHETAMHYAPSAKNSRELAELPEETIAGVRASVISTLPPENHAPEINTAPNPVLKFDSELAKQLDWLATVLSNVQSSINHRRTDPLDHIGAAKRRKIIAPLFQTFFTLVRMIAWLKDSLMELHLKPSNYALENFINSIKGDIDVIAQLSVIKPKLEALNSQLCDVRDILREDKIPEDLHDSILEIYHLPHIVDLSELYPSHLYRAASVIRHDIVHQRFPRLQLYGEMRLIPDIIAYARSKNVDLFEGVDGSWLDSLGIPTKQLPQN